MLSCAFAGESGCCCSSVQYMTNRTAFSWLLVSGNSFSFLLGKLSGVLDNFVYWSRSIPMSCNCASQLWLSECVETLGSRRPKKSVVGYNFFEIFVF